VNKKIAKNMYSNFDYIKIDPSYYFFRSVLNFIFFAKLLETNTKY